MKYLVHRISSHIFLRSQDQETLNCYISSGRKLIKTRPEQKRKVNLGVFTIYFHKSGYIWVYSGYYFRSKGSKRSLFHFHTAKRSSRRKLRKTRLEQKKKIQALYQGVFTRYFQKMWTSLGIFKMLLPFRRKEIR